MKSISLNNGTGNRIEFLKQKERDIRAALAAEHEKQRKREAKDNQRLWLVVGQAVMQTAAQNEGFSLMLKQTLDSVVMDEGTRTFLQRKGAL